MDTNLDLRIDSRWGRQSNKFKCLFWGLTLALFVTVCSSVYPAWFGSRGLWFDASLEQDLPSNTSLAGLEVTRMANGACLGLLTTGYLLEMGRLFSGYGTRCARYQHVPSQMFLIGGVIGIASFGFSWLTLRDPSHSSASEVGWAGVTSVVCYTLVCVISSRVMLHADSAMSFACFGVRWVARLFYFLSQVPVVALDASLRLCRLPTPLSPAESLEAVVSSSRLRSFSHLIEGETNACVSDHLQAAAAGCDAGRGRAGSRGLEAAAPMLPTILEEGEEQDDVSMEQDDVSMEQDDASMEQDDASMEQDDASMEQDDVSMEPDTEADDSEPPYACVMQPGSELVLLQHLGSDPPDAGCSANSDDAVPQNETSLSSQLPNPYTQGISN